MVQLYYSLALSLVWPLSLAARIVQHDAHFHPDVVLHVTAEVIPIACTSRYTVVVNGTTPGPLIVLDEGKTSWIRVYNDIPNQNLTMVGPGLLYDLDFAELKVWTDYSIGMALVSRPLLFQMVLLWPASGPSLQATSSTTRSNPSMVKRERTFTTPMSASRQFRPPGPWLSAIPNLFHMRMTRSRWFCSQTSSTEPMRK
jgi:hypothetical protein